MHDQKFYSVSARGYLERARIALLSEEPRSLFYAAFELRCCTERRQAEYANALLALARKRIKSWKVSETSKRIRQVSYSDKIAHMCFDFGDGPIDSYHTPVSDGLVEIVEKVLGKLLHSQSQFRQPTDPWWEETRASVVGGYQLAWLACRGDSLVPPLIDRKTGKTHPLTIDVNEGNKRLCNWLAKKGEPFKVTINYLDKAPADWICDL